MSVGSIFLAVAALAVLFALAVLMGKFIHVGNAGGFVETPISPEAS